MKERDEESRPDAQGEHLDTPARAAEQGDVADTDAPTSGEENEGMSTVLSADPLAGVQKDAGDE